MIRWLLASIHLLGLGIGLGAVWTRARALGGEPDARAIRQALAADTWWGIAAAIWIVSGAIRAFGGLEKGTNYYLHSHAFLGKMGLLAVILALEVWPMVTLIQWRMRMIRGETPDTGKANAIARISYAQALIVLLMVFAAAAMARGLGR